MRLKFSPSNELELTEQDLAKIVEEYLGGAANSNAPIKSVLFQMSLSDFTLEAVRIVFEGRAPRQAVLGASQKSDGELSFSADKLRAIVKEYVLLREGVEIRSFSYRILRADSKCALECLSCCANT